MKARPGGHVEIEVGVVHAVQAPQGRHGMKHDVLKIDGEIKQLLRLQRMPACRDARALAAAKLSAVEQRMAALEHVRGALRRLVGECDAGGMRSCPIIEALARG